jgi:hypothetical protein
VSEIDRIHETLKMGGTIDAEDAVIYAQHHAGLVRQNEEREVGRLIAIQDLEREVAIRVRAGTHDDDNALAVALARAAQWLRGDEKPCKP